MSRSQLIIINLAVWIVLPFAGFLLLQSTLPQVCDGGDVSVMGLEDYTGTRDPHNSCAITILDEQGRLASDSVYYDNGYNPPPGASQRQVKLVAGIAMILAPPAISMVTVFIYRDRNRSASGTTARRERLAELHTDDEPDAWFEDHERPEDDELVAEVPEE